jgi:hypothetical protein
MLLILGCAGTKMTPSKQISGTKIYARTDWHSLPITTGYKKHTIKKITVHHGGVEHKSDRRTDHYLRSLQFWSRRDRPWPDIPYHFIIDLEGKIWEGRPLQFSGDTNTEYDLTGHALIVLVGNYEVQEVSQKQLDSTINLMVSLCQEYKLNPDEIAGHKDYSNNTDCPGKNLYRYLEDGTIVTEVKKRLK